MNIKVTIEYTDVETKLEQQTRVVQVSADSVTYEAIKDLTLTALSDAHVKATGNRY